MKGKDRSMAAQGGFSLVELLVVVGIIVVLGGIALPNIYTYMRQARIRAGMREVSGAIQTARTRAVLKNINNGVVFAIENTNPANTYWIHVEDDQAVPKTTSQQMPLDLAVTGGNAQSTRYRLPPGVVFASTAQCTATPAPALGYNPLFNFIRFNRLGATCDPNVAACPGVAIQNGTLVNRAHFNGGTFVLCLKDARDPNDNSAALSRWLQISPGGIVLEQR
jgi:prepilin-type N-terminal cleavage/methylation domain-containing protein